jgi:hypothetical protein
MKIGELDWQTDSEEVITLRCPRCQTPWVTNHNGNITLGACEHLRFIWAGEGGLEYYGDWDTEAFEKQYLEAYGKVEEYEDPEEVFMGPDADVLAPLVFPEIDEVLWFTETGMACGPVTITACYGIKYNQ